MTGSLWPPEAQNLMIKKTITEAFYPHFTNGDIGPKEVKPKTIQLIHLTGRTPLPGSCTAGGYL